MTTTQAPAAGSGIDLKTLWITAVSSAAAAYVCSKLWTPGTLAAAAFTPVLVAIVREALAKSTKVIVEKVPVRGVVRSARPEGPQAPPDAVAPAGGWSAADLAAAAAASASASAEPPPDPDDPAARVPQPGEISYHGTGGTRRARNWRVAVITGLLGFLIAAVVFTVPELVAGGSAAGGGRDTTLFGGQQQRKDSETPAGTTTTQTVPARTVTAPPETTVTVPPQTVTTPPPATTLPEEPEPETATTPTTTVPPPEEPLPEVPPG